MFGIICFFDVFMFFEVLDIKKKEVGVLGVGGKTLRASATPHGELLVILVIPIRPKIIKMKTF